jgi:hypothetical protein
MPVGIDNLVAVEHASLIALARAKLKRALLSPLRRFD